MISDVIRKRLEELGLEQRDLARAAAVTESYISQLLNHKKLPPAPNRTDIYDKMAKVLKLPSAELVKRADLQRKEHLKRKLGDPPGPLFKEVRALILRKCRPGRQSQVRAIFAHHPFGELERFVTQKLLDVVKGVAKQELDSEQWLRRVARVSHQSYERMRVLILEFLDTTIANLSSENCIAFLDPLIDSWDIDIDTFAMDIVLNPRVTPGDLKQFEFVERDPDKAFDEEPGMKEFLKDRSLCGDATADELEFLRKLRFEKRRPTVLYYYRELQSLRDPLHFRTAPAKK